MTLLESISAKGWEAVVNTNPDWGFSDGARVLPAKHEQARRGHRQHRGRHLGLHARHKYSGAARAGMVSLTETAAVEGGPAMACA